MSEENNFNSGLISWYNNLLNKSLDELDIINVSKMIRQDVVKNIAMKKAIQFLMDNPYGGEYFDGGLLNVIASCDINIKEIKSKKELITFLDKLKFDYKNYDWQNEEDKDIYGKNIEILLDKLHK